MDSTLEQQDSVVNIINVLLPDTPLYVSRINSLIKAVNFFLNNFKGETLYAVKANPDPLTIKTLDKLGIKKYDVASLAEIINIKTLIPDAELYFMHPVKSREDIRKAYYKYGVRHFSLDTTDELKKIIEETENASYLKLYVRFAVPNNYSTHKLSDKFGANPKEASFLLKECQKFTKKLGLCFHIGTQCMDPQAYRFGIRLAKKIIEESNVEIQVLDVGGGFPSIYPQSKPPPLISYFEAINEELDKCKLTCQLLCEPGRALVAESGAIITKVILRKGQFLYLNDGVYGNLFDCGGCGGGLVSYSFPVKLIRSDPLISSFIPEKLPFSFFGPTCDSIDFMPGPFMLPADIREGDYIEIGQTGAYSTSLRTNFNGFGMLHGNIVSTEEPPIISMYD